MHDPDPDELSREFIDFYDDIDTPIDLLSETRYIDREFIAEGAVKNVYKVYDSHCSRSVALALIKDNIFSLEQSVDFIREVQTTATLEHPNIIRIYDIGLKDGKPWFTMEYLSGRNLEEYLCTGPTHSLFERLDIFRQLCDAVAYAHSHDILHLDLKPQNVNVGEYRQIKLCDWGISSSISEHSLGDLNRAQTTHGYIKGSPGYMAPEQTLADYKKHPTADIYGLGSMLYFLLTGSAPVDGSTPEELLKNTQSNKLNTLDHPSIPARLITVLSKALDTDPKNRYESAAELKTEIENFQSGYALEAESSSFPTQLKLFIRRNKTPSLVVGCLLVLLTAFTTYYISEITLEKNKTQVALTEVEHQRLKSEQAKEEAEDAKSIAEDALESYRKEQLALNETNNELADILIDGNLLNLRSFQFEKALETALAAHEKKPTPLTQMRISFSAFVLQKFDIAAKYSEGIENKKHKTVHKLALKFAGKPTPLGVSDCIEIYDSLGVGYANLPIYFLDQCSQTLSPYQFSKLLAHVLKKNNKRKSINFIYSPKLQNLNLSGNGNLNTTLEITWNQQRKYEYNLLSLLPIRTLTVDNSFYNRSQSYSSNMSKDFKVNYR
ncbi:serine/threonine-protein kinase [Rubritalea sp.]|uniref:serine/threonine-protein kinase n=1 Tax=Rubritalea sp. TaxID=2109375 RepID=UPI003EF626B2